MIKAQPTFTSKKMAKEKKRIYVEGGEGGNEKTIMGGKKR